MLAKTNPFVTSRPDHAEHPHTARLLHTSDVHVGNDSRAGEAAEWPEMSLVYLSDVVKLLREQSGDCLLITGDFFDHNRVREELCVLAGEILGRAGAPVVILPGNHDPYMANSPYVKFRSAFPDNVHIISKEEGELIVLGDAGVQVWGQAHSRYDDFAPVGMAPAWVDDVHAAPGSKRGRRLWRVSVAHGHYVQSDFEKRYSYLVHDHELEALQAHYVGLGHLEVHTQVGPPSAAAWYAGSPDISGGATMIDLTPQGLEVRHVNFGSGTIGKTPLDSEYGPALSVLR